MPITNSSWPRAARSQPDDLAAPIASATIPPSPALIAAASLERERPRSDFVFVGERLWLDFVNTEGSRSRGRVDALLSFDGFVRWMESAGALDGERASAMRRRALQQPAAATAALVDARRMRATLRQLAERGSRSERVRGDALQELNRVLGRSAGTRKLELRRDGTIARTFVPVGDAYSGLLIPVVESASDALVSGELSRVRRCAAHDCSSVFFDTTRNGARRWCDMSGCGNRAKAARHRARAVNTPADAPVV